MPRSTSPWQLWLVAILALLWAAGGAFDYLMTQTRHQLYMAQFTPEQRAFFYGLPSWVVACWAMAVWGGVLGALLMLLRSRRAVGVLLVSWLAMVVTTVHNYGFSNGMAVMGDPFSLGFTAVIFIVALLLYLYARALAERGILR
ncbi:hypothetical protein SAMN04488540_103136 [Ferrimonas sediminum]|uniref:DoxX-like family protein n=1 Tax=Ferrimonas sediminum TaxID=718193 RepID=A0A1G8NIF7_9GAMM|nr:hypothetical protein [Ferrimonas sediminum]SDI79887.1 hypothetical protein SAMN04488540_103136 [Ferrimonas sediminum]